METLELETTEALVEELTNRSTAIIVALIPKSAKNDNECQARVIGPQEEIKDLAITINMHIIREILGDPDD